MERPNTSEVAATGLALGVLAATWGAVDWAPTSALRWLLAGCALVGTAILTLWGLLGPGARWLSGERTELTATERRDLSPAERLEAINSARSALLQSVTGLVVIVGVVFTAASLLYTARTLDLTRQGQVTDRYTKAIEQLGSDRPEVRMGGIYALERLMVDSERIQDRRTITEVLCSYIRSHAQDKPPVGSNNKRLAVDVESALLVLGRADFPSGTRINLVNSDFHGKSLGTKRLPAADLTAANLSNVVLNNSNLSGAILSIANLSGATLYTTDLSNANLYGANLHDAYLGDANLSGASLTNTYGRGVQRFGANFSGADLSGADLRNADLRSADLRGADLTAANLSGSNLSGANLIGAKGVRPEDVRRVAQVDTWTRF